MRSPPVQSPKPQVPGNLVAWNGLEASWAREVPQISFSQANGIGETWCYFILLLVSTSHRGFVCLLLTLNSRPPQSSHPPVPEHCWGTCSSARQVGWEGAPQSWAYLLGWAASAGEYLCGERWEWAERADLAAGFGEGGGSGCHAHWGLENTSRGSGGLNAVEPRAGEGVQIRGTRQPVGREEGSSKSGPSCQKG